MKKIIIFAFVVFAFYLPVCAQIHHELDINNDGEINIFDIEKLTDIIKGADNTETPESIIAGTWISTDGDMITFSSDGTTEYANTKTFIYDNAQSRILFMNQNEQIIKTLEVINANSAFLILKEQEHLKVFYNSLLIANSIEIDCKNIELEVKNNKKLTATILPMSSFYTSVEWNSSDNTVATVSKEGVVTGHASGSCIISATTTDGSNLKDECNVTVTGTDERQRLITLNTAGASVVFSNDNEYEWKWSDRDYGFHSTNYSNLTTSQTSLYIQTKYLCDFSFTYKMESEINCDKLTIILDGEVILNGISGYTGGTYKSKLQAGCHTLILSYSKDRSEDWGDDYAGIKNMKFERVINYDYNQEYVDLGLSVKWATFNVGAESPEEYGYHFAWGATKPMETYDENNYFDPSFSIYNNVSRKTVLAPEHDAAHIYWGGDWRMPTYSEFKELKDNCIWQWTSNYNNSGKSGYLVKSKKLGYTDNFIFLPAAGYKFRFGPNDNGEGGWGNYWTNTLYDEDDSSLSMHFYNKQITPFVESRYDGLSIRPVHP